MSDWWGKSPRTAGRNPEFGPVFAGIAEFRPFWLVLSAGRFRASGVAPVGRATLSNSNSWQLVVLWDGPDAGSLGFWVRGVAFFRPDLKNSVKSVFLIFLV